MSSSEQTKEETNEQNANQNDINKKDDSLNAAVEQVAESNQKEVEVKDGEQSKEKDNSQSQKIEEREEGQQEDEGKGEGEGEEKKGEEKKEEVADVKEENGEKGQSEEKEAEVAKEEEKKENQEQKEEEKKEETVSQNNQPEKTPEVVSNKEEPTETQENQPSQEQPEPKSEETEKEVPKESVESPENPSSDPEPKKSLDDPEPGKIYKNESLKKEIDEGENLNENNEKKVEENNESKENKDNNENNENNDKEINENQENVTQNVNEKEEENSNEKEIENINESVPENENINLNGNINVNENEEQKFTEIKVPENQEPEQEEEQGNKFFKEVKKYFGSIENLNLTGQKNNSFKFGIKNEVSQSPQTQNSVSLSLFLADKSENTEEQSKKSEKLTLKVFTKSADELLETIENRQKEGTLFKQSEFYDFNAKNFGEEGNEEGVEITFTPKGRNDSLENQEEQVEQKEELDFLNELETILRGNQRSEDVQSEQNQEFNFEFKFNPEFSKDKEPKRLFENFVNNFEFTVNVNGGEEFVQRFRKNVEKNNLTSRINALISLSKNSLLKLKWRKIEDVSLFLNKLGILEVVKQTPTIKEALKDCIEEIFESHQPSQIELCSFLQSILKGFETNQILINRANEQCGVSLVISGQNCKKLIL